MSKNILKNFLTKYTYFKLHIPTYLLLSFTIIGSIKFINKSIQSLELTNIFGNLKTKINMYIKYINIPILLPFLLPNVTKNQ